MFIDGTVGSTSTRPSTSSVSRRTSRSSSSYPTRRAASFSSTRTIANTWSRRKPNRSRCSCGRSCQSITRYALMRLVLFVSHCSVSFRVSMFIFMCTWAHEPPAYNYSAVENRIFFLFPTLIRKRNEAFKVWTGCQWGGCTYEFIRVLCFDFRYLISELASFSLKFRNLISEIICYFSESFHAFIRFLGLAKNRKF